MDDEARDFAGRSGVRRVCGAFLLTTDDQHGHRCGRVPEHTGWHQCIKGHGGPRCQLRWSTDEATVPRPLYRTARPLT